MDSSKIVTTNGCFDILHPGHIESFRQAKSLGDRLIVLLNSDASIKRIKGQYRPINNQDFRKTMLESIKYIDRVIIFDEDDPRRILDTIQPDFHVKSKEGYKGLEQDVVESHGGKIVLLEDLPGYSSTEICKRASQAYINVVLKHEI